MDIKKAGFYVSEPFHWIDWNASVKSEGDNYYLLKFHDEKCFFDLVDSLEKININHVSKNPKHCLYKIVNDKIIIRYNPNTEFELERIFSILSPDLLLDENLKEYRYVEPSANS